MNRRLAAVGLLLAGAYASQAPASCGAAFCLVNTSWDMHGAWASPGWRLDLRYESIRQDRLQEGRRTVAVGEVPRAHDEVETVNRNWLASLDYTFDADWGVNVALPVVRRRHLHIESQTEESWNFSELGDARVLARYRIGAHESADHSLGTLGLNLGVKLPTGSFDVQNADGERAERMLQPGTGTTDALLGAYYAQVLPLKDLSWFVQGLAQLPLDSRDGYRPGRRVTLDAGLRYDLGEEVSLLLQANALYRGRDAGVNAEPQDSGGRAWFLSPGLSAAATKDVRIYGFLQAPLYQYVNGVQLAARRGAVIGLSARF